MTVRLRPHHLLCLLTWKGEGYTPAFSLGFDRVADRLAAGEAASVGDGPDAICAGWLAAPGEETPHCHEPRIVARDDAARRDLTALGLDLDAALHLDGRLIARMRAAFAAGQVRSACAACQWRPLCDGVAEDGFAAARLAC